MSPNDSKHTMDTRRTSQPSTVMVNIAESEEDPRRFHMEVNQAQMQSRHLNPKDYPLYHKPTPPELLAFTYNVPSSEAQDDTEPAHVVRPLASIKVAFANLTERTDKPRSSIERTTPGSPKILPARDASIARASRADSRSPSEAYPRRPRSSRQVPGPTDGYPKQQDLGSQLRSAAQKLRGASGEASTTRRSSRQPRSTSSFLATPDATSEQNSSSAIEQGLTSRPRLGLGAEQFGSPRASNTAANFGSNVATPPITDADAEPFEDGEDHHSTRGLLHHPRPSIDVVAAQDASLPSPRLSPTLATSQPNTSSQEQGGESGDTSFATSSFALGKWDSGSIKSEDEDAMALSMIGSQSRTRDGDSIMMDPFGFLDTFDMMNPDMQSYMMYQLLRRCARPTLRVVANAVNPALKCDFFSQLPLELSYHVMSYLDFRDLCRAAQVSKHWRNIVDRNETGWKELFDRDGFELPAGELNKAIAQGWGWQDPVGHMGVEKDLSMHRRLTTSEQELTKALPPPAPKTRLSKRKRALNAHPSSERSKRRASAQEALSREEKAQVEVKQHRSAGPLSAANAAASAVPDPHLGLPSLRELHLFKSLYRRHHMIRQSWMSGKVKPSHVAFAAHPRHVITCLQFDDDKIITGSDDTFIHVYDTKTGKLRNKLFGHEGGVWALQYEGNILVSGSTDRTVRVWDIERGVCQQVFHGHTSTVRCLQILMPAKTGTGHDGKAIMQPEKPLIITGSRDSQLRIWRLPEIGSKRYTQSGAPASDSECPYFIRALHGHTHSVRAISAHGDTLVSGSYDSVVRVWRISTGECLHSLHGHSQKVYSVVLDHERNRCISGSMDSLVKIWDLRTGACLYTLEGHSLLVGLLDLRDERLVSAAADSTLRIWDPESGRCKSTLMAHTGAITCFQHDAGKVISGSEKTVKMWDIQTGECVQDLLTDLGGVWQVKFNGRRCVAAVQRDQFTYVEILDFGAVRDGQAPEDLGRRILLNEDEVPAMIEEEP
ncbi:Cell division control protein-like protein [Emericellopsis cladophorae]|uniref:Cell division control protein-like protein n=1 Tax=Emericellopsis cladophorae TaxID=2686198 RepID=A0A9P9Y4Y3_9HYPO|nr:Cell division control protein-like protein [Emericellopsis cladophorae]KAI6783624.1 Cell division control protein-like protein [Emericellopsis cladophorae]